MYTQESSGGEALAQYDNIRAEILQIADLRQPSPFAKALRLEEGEARRVVREDDRQHVFDAERGRALQHFLQEPLAEAAAASFWRDVDADFGADAVGGAWVVVAEAAPGDNRAVRLFHNVERVVVAVRGKPRLP